ncbi:uncharacterized protein LOC113314184 isoform X3 [Papaver somniferum]|nr:uncharacterized protein LOC113314184 isoform X3 [Papaver somniferum]
MGPNITSFLKCLRGNSSYCKKMMDEKKWRHLLAHPNFMDPEEKVDNLVAIRYSLRGSMGKNCKITMAELGWNPVAAPISDWEHLVTEASTPYCIRQHFYDAHAGRVKDVGGRPVITNYDTKNPLDLIKFLRDTYEHVNDIAQGWQISKRRFGSWIDTVAPGLLPVHFEKHGSLRDRYETVESTWN